MENNIINGEQYIEARRLHGDIMAYGENCAAALVGLCKSLKQMRDSKLYEALGSASFDEYCTSMVGIKARMAYNYIAAYEHFGESVLQSNAQLGITKLSLIAQLPAVDQVEKLETGELNEMSVAEIKELVKKSKMQGEQLSLLEDEAEKAEKTIDELKADIERLEAEHDEKIEQLKAAHRTELSKAKVASEKPILDEASLKRKIRSEIELENKKKIDKAVKAEVAKQKADIERTARQSAEAEAQKAVAELTVANKRAEELSKQLNMSDSKQTTVNIYFNALREDFTKLITAVGQLDEEQQAKYKTALSSAFDQFKAAIS